MFSKSLISFKVSLRAKSGARNPAPSGAPKIKPRCSQLYIARYYAECHCVRTAETGALCHFGFLAFHRVTLFAAPEEGCTSACGSALQLVAAAHPLDRLEQQVTKRLAATYYLHSLCNTLCCCNECDHGRLFSEDSIFDAVSFSEIEHALATALEGAKRPRPETSEVDSCAPAAACGVSHSNADDVGVDFSQGRRE